MYRVFFLLIAIIFGSISMESLFAAGCDEIQADIPDSPTIISQVDRCIVARASQNPNSITDFVCPQGEFYSSSNQPITRETLAYLIAVQISLNKVDLEVIKYMKQLQKTREANMNEWLETINSCTEKITGIYSHICGLGTLEALLNADKNKLYITTTATYPQTLCTDLAARKIA
jgi:hypothetical protein